MAENGDLYEIHPHAVKRLKQRLQKSLYRDGKPCSPPTYKECEEMIRAAMPKKPEWHGQFRWAAKDGEYHEAFFIGRNCYAVVRGLVVVTVLTREMLIKGEERRRKARERRIGE